jgi:hypothetical protein
MRERSNSIEYSIFDGEKPSVRDRKAVLSEVDLHDKVKDRGTYVLILFLAIYNYLLKCTDT